MFKHTKVCSDFWTYVQTYLCIFWFLNLITYVHNIRTYTFCWNREKFRGFWLLPEVATQEEATTSSIGGRLELLEVRAK